MKDIKDNEKLNSSNEKNVSGGMHGKFTSENPIYYCCQCNRMLDQSEAFIFYKRLGGRLCTDCYEKLLEDEDTRDKITMGGMSFRDYKVKKY